jgi:P27 family predicted phage terminase small subunit
MPTPLKHSENMKKHLTKAELEARQQAESGLQREKRVYLKAPKWLSEEAREIFNQTKKRLKGLDLLEPVDIDLLANYADAMARYQEGVKRLDPADDLKEPLLITDTRLINAIQAWSRIALAYAEKLGFSQNARARLARRRAKTEPVDPLAQMLDNVSEFVNHGNRR